MPQEVGRESSGSATAQRAGFLLGSARGSRNPAFLVGPTSQLSEVVSSLWLKVCKLGLDDHSLGMTRPDSRITEGTLKGPHSSSGAPVTQVTSITQDQPFPNPSN